MAARNTPQPQEPKDAKAPAPVTDWEEAFQASLANIAKLPRLPESEEGQKLREEHEFHDADNAQSLCHGKPGEYRSAPFFSHSKAKEIMRLFYFKGYTVLYMFVLDRTKKYRMIICRFAGTPEQLDCKKMRTTAGEVMVAPEGWTPFCPDHLAPLEMLKPK